MQKFSLGQVVATPAVLQTLQQTGHLPLEFLARHQAGDWGVVSKSDARANEQALKDGGRILSAYLLSDGTRIWIITSAADDQGNRESTCILLPEDY